MTYLALIDHQTLGQRRWEASLHGMKLADDGVITAGMPHNRSHAALERMKARRARDHG